MKKHLGRWMVAGLLGVLPLFGQTAQFPTSVADNADLLVARNNAQSTLAAGIDDAVTTFTVAAASSFISDMVVVIGSEQIFCTTFAGTTFSVCTRGFNSTVAAAHLEGVNVSGYLVAWHHNTLAAELKAIEQSLIGTSYIGTFVRLGGTTSSFPALKRDGTELESWLADGSALAPFQASLYRINTNGILEYNGGMGALRLFTGTAEDIILETADASPIIFKTNSVERLQITDSGVDAAVGFRVAGAATTAQFLRGNGTNFVDAAIQAGDLPDGVKYGAIEFEINGGGTAVPTGTKSWTQAQYDGTIQSVEITSAASCSIAFDFWQDSYANWPPTNVDSICDAGTCPAIVAATKYQNATLTSWTTNITRGNFYLLQVDSADCTGIVKVILRAVRD